MNRPNFDPEERRVQVAPNPRIPGPGPGTTGGTHESPEGRRRGAAAPRRSSRHAARGIRRTYYLPPDVADRFDQVVEDLAYELRIPKLDVLGVLLTRAIEGVYQVDGLRREPL
ncbi:MAG: hypothetical protein ACQSGP_19805 [Frankia sp.]